MNRPILTVRQLIAGYSGQAVLHRVDMAVHAGEVVTLLGANGAGKSTLLKTVVGTVPVIAGRTICVDTSKFGVVTAVRMPDWTLFQSDGTRTRTVALRPEDQRHRN